MTAELLFCVNMALFQKNKHANLCVYAKYLWRDGVPHMDGFQTWHPWRWPSSLLVLTKGENMKHKTRWPFLFYHTHTSLDLAFVCSAHYRTASTLTQVRIMKPQHFNQQKNNNKKRTILKKFFCQGAWFITDTSTSVESLQCSKVITKVMYKKTPSERNQKVRWTSLWRNIIWRKWKRMCLWTSGIHTLQNNL